MRNYAKKRRLKRYISMIIVLSIIGYGLVVYLEKYQNSDFNVVKISDEVISKDEINAKITEIFSANSQGTVKTPDVESLPEEVIETISKEIYLEKKLVQKAKDADIDSERSVRNKIKRAKNRILVDSYLENEINKSISDEKIKEKYLELSNRIEGKREFLIYQIVVDSEKRAKWIYRVYNETSPSRKMRKFAELAKKYSIDSESANNSGKLGYILEDDIIKEVADEISSYKRSGYTKPIKTEFGWHIVFVRKIRDAEMLPFEKSYENLKNQIMRDRTEQIYDDIFKDFKMKILIDLKEPEQSSKIETENE